MTTRSTLTIAAFATLNVFVISVLLGARPASGAGPGVVITSPLAADGSVRTSAPLADEAPFGAATTFTIPGGAAIGLSLDVPFHITAYSFHTDNDIIVVFLDGNVERFGVRVPAGQSMTQSFAHALLANGIEISCPGANPCTLFRSIVGYGGASLPE